MIGKEASTGPAWASRLMTRRTLLIRGGQFAGVAAAAGLLTACGSGDGGEATAPWSI
jgi:hypothetical protein